MPYYQVYESSTGGWVWEHSMHDQEELQENLEASRILADHGHKIQLLPTLDKRFPEAREDLLPDVYANKNPDIRIDFAVLGDIKTPIVASQSAINRAIYRAGVQAVTIAIINLDGKHYTVRDVKKGIVGAIQPDRNRSIREVWIITRTKALFKVTREIVYNDGIYDILEHI